LLQRIETIQPDLVGKIRREIEEEGELDDYWAGKLEMLVELEMV
jgi:hypothetical protein